MSVPTVHCCVCDAVPPGTSDTVAVDPPLTWSREVDRGDVRWMCEACSRVHVRAIEGRLDQRWW